MKALERYVKKSGKAQPYGKTKPKGEGRWEGPKGVKDSDQYADESSGKKVVDDTKDSDETDPATGTGKYGAYEAVRGYKAKKNKQRSYLD